MATTTTTTTTTTTKVFVGNLAFATTTETLKKEFGAAGEVVNANIISRGPRSLGYGFVELANEATAQKAVELLHHKELDGRVINVEIARNRPEGEEHKAGEDADGERPRRRRQRKPRANGEEVAAEGTSSPSTSTKPAGARPPRRRYSQKDQPQGEAAQGEEPRRFKKAYRPREEGAAATEGGEATQGGARRGGRGRGRGAPRTFQPKTRQTNGEATQTSEAGPSTSAPKPRRVRQPRQPVKRQEDRIPSETTLFVANLPFATTDEQLKALFAKAAPVTAAHVVTRKNGKSKGFGFVEFATKEDQEAGLKAVDGSEVEGRKLNVKVALKAPPTDGAGASGAAGDAAAEPAKAAEPKTEAKAPEASGEKEKDKVSA